MAVRSGAAPEPAEIVGSSPDFGVGLTSEENKTHLYPQVLDDGVAYEAGACPVIIRGGGGGDRVPLVGVHRRLAAQPAAIGRRLGPTVGFVVRHDGDKSWWPTDGGDRCRAESVRLARERRNGHGRRVKAQRRDYGRACRATAVSMELLSLIAVKT